jgi:glycosyltransferase involved in cell wall biosynthesis
LPLAIQSYLSQDYENKELIVIDDGDDLIQDMVKDIPGVRYYFYPADNLSQKRNAGLRFAEGDVVIHFDSDDWSGPGRMRHQVEHLQGRKVTGYSKAFWYDTLTDRATYASCGLWGATLCYDRKWALSHPWDETRINCEDAFFLAPAVDENVIGEQEGGENFVALAHRRNFARPFGQSGWGIIANELLPEGFRRAYVRN